MSKTLMVYLAADTDRFRREMRRADDSIDNLGKRSAGLGGMIGGLGTMMAGAAIAAGAFAIKLGVDAVNAAMDEEAELAKLNTTLENMGFASAQGQVSAFIDDMQYSANIADSELRPAFDRLIRSTENVGKAQELMSLALDISAGTGKSLKTVTDALGKAMDGNTGALGKLGTGLDKATLATGDMDVITGKLAQRFNGQSAAAAATMKSRLEGVKIAADETAEAFGTGLLQGLEDAAGGSDDLEQMFRDLGTTAEIVGRFLGGALVAYFNYLTASVRVMGNAISLLDKGFILLSYGLGRISEDEKNARLAAADANIAFNNQEITARGLAAGHALASMFVQGTTDAFNRNEHQSRRTTDATDDNTDSTDDNSNSQDNAASATDKATEAMRRQRESVDEAATALNKATQEVKGWTEQIISYKNSLTDTILSVDLRAAFEQQGKEGGLSLLDAFRGQLSDAKNFAGLLKQMKEAGASQALIDEVAGLGAQAGGELAQQLLDEGLVKTISDEWDKARAEIFDVTSTLVPDFLIQGQNNALAMLEGLTSKTREEEATLRAIGKEMGKPIGAEIKAAVAAAMADALAAAKAAAAAVTIPTSPATAAGVPEATGVVPIVPATTYTDFSTSYNLTNVLAQAQNRGGIIGDGINLVFQ